MAAGTTWTRSISSAAVTAAATYDGSPRSVPASHKPLMARPFHAATTLSSRAGRGRSSRASSSRARTSESRACSPGLVGKSRSWSVEVPCSNVPSSVTPKTFAAHAPRSWPSASTSCSGVQT